MSLVINNSNNNNNTCSFEIPSHQINRLVSSFPLKEKQVNSSTVVGGPIRNKPVNRSQHIDNVSKRYMNIKHLSDYLMNEMNESLRQLYTPNKIYGRFSVKVEFAYIDDENQHQVIGDDEENQIEEKEFYSFKCYNEKYVLIQKPEDLLNTSFLLITNYPFFSPSTTTIPNKSKLFTTYYTHTFQNILIYFDKKDNEHFSTKVEQLKQQHSDKHTSLIDQELFYSQYTTFTIKEYQTKKMSNHFFHHGFDTSRFFNSENEFNTRYYFKYYKDLLVNKFKSTDKSFYHGKAWNIYCEQDELLSVNYLNSIVTSESNKLEDGNDGDEEEVKDTEIVNCEHDGIEKSTSCTFTGVEEDSSLVIESKEEDNDEELVKEDYFEDPPGQAEHPDLWDLC